MNNGNEAIKKEIIDWLVHFVLAIVVTLFIITYIGQITIVQGNSMLPTLRNNNIIIIEKLALRLGNIKQGNIVVIKIPELLGDNKSYAVKRVLATEGQKVEILDGQVFVDGEIIEEKYTNGGDTFATGDFSDMVVPKNCIYVLGDNRLPGASKDSRVFGPISKDRVAGKAVFRLYPFSEIGVVE
ncbi:MAG TPA: signal peptidase I [Thermoclostridium sp.]|nr:signal peptidase I [Thermoclostridium sp.]